MTSEIINKLIIFLELIYYCGPCDKLNYKNNISVSVQSNVSINLLTFSISTQYFSIGIYLIV